MANNLKMPFAEVIQELEEDEDEEEEEEDDRKHNLLPLNGSQRWIHYLIRARVRRALGTLNLFKPNGISHFYQLDQSISV